MATTFAKLVSRHGTGLIFRTLYLNKKLFELILIYQHKLISILIYFIESDFLSVRFDQQNAQLSGPFLDPLLLATAKAAAGYLESKPDMFILESFQKFCVGWV